MQNNKEITKARSKNNGIVFYSNMFPFVGLETFYDDSGNMHSRLIYTPLDEHNCYLEAVEDGIIVNKKNLHIFNIALIIISIIRFVFTKNIGLILASIYFSILVSYDLFKIAKISYSMKLKKGKNYSKAKFHAAEHMVINAYKKLQRIPKLEEAKRFSRFSKMCGSRKIINRTFFCTMQIIATATLCSYNIIIYIIVFLLILGFMLLDEKYNYLRFLQVFITNKPTDKEIELAIEGLKQFEIMEKKLENEEDFS